MFKKNILASCLILFSVFIFAGCSGAQSTAIYYADGSRATSFEIIVDSDFCETNNIDADAAMSVIGRLAIQQELRMRALHPSVKGVTIQHGPIEDNAYGYQFSLTFASAEAVRAFYEIPENSTAEAPREHGLFASHLIVQNTAVTDENGRLNTANLGIYMSYDHILGEFANALFAGDTSQCESFFDNVEILILKAFPSEYKYRSNADIKQKMVLQAGLNNDAGTVYTAHAWHGTLATPPSEIYIYVNYLDANNRLAWYILAIIMTAIFGAILTICLVIKNNKKNKLIQKIEPIDQNSIEITPNSGAGNGTKNSSATTTSAQPSPNSAQNSSGQQNSGAENQGLPKNN